MAQQTQQQDDQPEEQGLSSRIGIVEINWPKTVGYYGGIGLALAAEIIEPPFALFIAAIPIFKMMSHPIMPDPVRIAGQMLEGAAQPVGGSDEASVHLIEGNRKSKKQAPGAAIWREARAIADRQRHANGGATSRRLATSGK